MAKIMMFGLVLLHCLMYINAKPDAKPCVRFYCFRNPCDLVDCGPEESCVPNYCGGCNAECKPCKNLVRCKRNPCDNVLCGPGETCTPNYCGGCNHSCRFLKS